MFCKHCGKEIHDDVKFCSACGGSISALAIEKPERFGSRKSLEGLGGWLVLVVIGLFIATSFQVYGAYQSVTMFSDGTVQFLSNPASEVYIPNYGGLLKFEFIAEIFFLMAGIYLIWLFFKRDRKFPKYYIWFLVASAVYVVLDYILIASISAAPEVQQLLDTALTEQIGEIGRTVISSVVWGSYIMKSRRVKATFIEG